MSASSAFGSQSSRSPQARAPILALSLSLSLSPVSFQPFLSTLSFHQKRIRSQHVSTFRVRPALFCTASLDPRFPSHFVFPSIFIPRNPRFLPFYRPASARIFFFFKIRDDEISPPFSFFYLLNFVVFHRIQIPSLS